MGNPTDAILAELEAEWPAWQFWTVYRYVGGLVWCCRRRDDHTRVLNADTPEHLTDALEDETSK